MSNPRPGKISAVLFGILLGVGGVVAEAPADRIDHASTQFGHQREFFTEQDEVKTLELTGTVLTINNDLGVDPRDPNAREALGEILTGSELAHFQMIFDRLATHWSVQLLPRTDGEMGWLLGDEPLTRAAPRKVEVSRPVGSGGGGGGATGQAPQPTPEVNALAVPEPATVALLALGAAVAMYRRPAH